MTSLVDRIITLYFVAAILLIGVLLIHIHSSARSTLRPSEDASSLPGYERAANSQA